MIHCYDANKKKLLKWTENLINQNAPMDVIDYYSHLTPYFKEKQKEMKQKNGITIRTSGDNLTIDQLNDIALDEIQILRENDISNISDYEEIVFSDAFQKKYHNIMGFDKNGHGTCFIFGTKMQNKK